MSPRSVVPLVLLCLAVPAAARADDATPTGPDSAYTFDWSNLPQVEGDPSVTEPTAGETPAPPTAGEGDEEDGSFGWLPPWARPHHRHRTRPVTASLGGARSRGLRLGIHGRVHASASVPLTVRRVIAAANRIARTPYRYGGGHGAFSDTAYDCSGSVSYALHGGNLLNTTLTSGQLESYGRHGKGRWITIYANAGHTFMVIAGLRYDTVGQNRTGSRWQPMDRSTRGFVVRHPTGY